MAPADIPAAFLNGQPFVAAALAGNKFKMTFTPDGKITREPLGQSGKPISGTLEAQCQGFLHELGTRTVQLFHSVPIGQNRWSVQKVATTISVSVATWSK